MATLLDTRDAFRRLRGQGGVTDVDEQVEEVEQRLTQRIDRLEERLGQQIEQIRSDVPRTVVSSVAAVGIPTTMFLLE